MLTHIHMVVYNWWCWHICKGDDNGEEICAKVNGGEHTCIAKESGSLVCARLHFHCMHFEKGKNRQALHALYAKEREYGVVCLLC